MGEFPAKWDLIENNAEVAKMNGKMAIKFEHGSNTEIMPLIKDGNKKYLPEFYTLEFDFFATGKEDTNSAYNLFLNPTDGDNSRIWFSQERMDWYIMKPNGTDRVDGNSSLQDVMQLNDWNHFALSFNKRALKVYINDKRIINIPNAKAMDWFSIQTEFWEDHVDYITNIRLAKGGVALYDRNEQSMTAVEKAIAGTGKFVTNNILFETGKATLKSESMEEIQKVADYMKKNPSVRFEVQGHTDNQGSDAINDPLSQKRAEAVVKALASLGCDEFNLRAVGKGSHEPVADNKTEAGRAKNRRVEFIKK
jgi:outer membrane protein OmpA-like peptidoglycan-associated protein